MEKEQIGLLQLIELVSQRASCIAYEGFPRDDLNLPGNLLIVESVNAIYSFPKKDIIDRESLPGEKVRVWVRVGTQAFRMSSFIVGSQSFPFTVGMEDIPPPSPREDPNAPKQAHPGEVKEVEVELLAVPSLSAVGAAWTNSCAGGDDYPNDCAHFLSDAFIRAGYSELLPPNPYINARCSPAKRPIRAREMWRWFQSKAVRTSRSVQRNTGWWAVFQLNERVYWGGHVVLLDSNNWLYYGTGWYGDWDQYLYQW